MTDTIIRRTGRAGRITLDRPRALNALTHAQSLEIEAAITAWADDPEVDVVVLDAMGEKAFCAGGDIAAMYHAGIAGDVESARAFWRDEYRLNARLATYPKPIAAFMQGFTMGGGVGLGGHVGCRVVGDSTRIAMPECGIGLVPDVGGSLLLARTPGHAGEYLGLTGARMKAADAIWAGFADLYLPEDGWPDHIRKIEETGSLDALREAARDPGASDLAARAPWIDEWFAHEDLVDALQHLEGQDDGFARETYEAVTRGSPLSAAVTFALIRDVRGHGTIEHALDMEYRATHRAISDGDLLEGIRAAVIDKDRTPKWRHDRIADVTGDEVAAMLAPLGT
ncbi:3-hydroxyisobutyryl-CoA hydrolase [Palleronia sp. LCG004]|uniref:3-hydroxyisobutyryl-CoA hydrolase n=1 Tax=Palleronia sp. LCG004 TaxID=3079304 RepID=UPI0029431560|nr:3-hydroxyisobutyryl-CoA hydrolase [Palleronia sp. LCG004]WOI55225.1 3-hydroxyisobutyryl-CoA hydrolase [Palleronia sp. LCG004]